MTKTIRTIGKICIIALIVMCVYAVAQPRYSMSADLTGEKRTVNYHELNVRETPDGKVVGSLELSNTVTLTGKTCTFTFKDDPFDSWMEIQYNGGNAWVTSDALR